MLNKLRFLFTGKLRVWVIQERCPKDYHDCLECGHGMFHDTGYQLTRETAIRNSVRSLEYYAEGDARATVTEIGDGHVAVELEDEDLWLEIYPSEVELT